MKSLRRDSLFPCSMAKQLLMFLVDAPLRKVSPAITTDRLAIPRLFVIYYMVRLAQLPLQHGPDEPACRVALELELVQFELEV